MPENAAGGQTPADRGEVLAGIKRARTRAPWDEEVRDDQVEAISGRGEVVARIVDYGDRPCVCVDPAVGVAEEDGEVDPDLLG